MKLKVVNEKFQPFNTKVGERHLRFEKEPVEVSQEEAIELLSQHGFLEIAEGEIKVAESTPAIATSKEPKIEEVKLEETKVEEKTLEEEIKE